MIPSKIEDLRVLIIDDDRHMRILIRNMLVTLGASAVVDAGDGKTGLQEVRDFKPNLILCDLKMEPMNGLEFVRRLRGNGDNPHRVVPVIMVTAYAELDVVAKARDAGVTEFMAKPISAAGLVKRIERVLKDERAYVEAPEFVGPDRRRPKQGRFSGDDRRENEPNFIFIPGGPDAGEPSAC